MVDEASQVPVGLQRPPSWSGVTALPSVGAWCSCCHIDVEAVREMRT